MKVQKVWLVTGASKGFGLEIAKSVLESGDKVAASVRSKPEQLAAALNNHPNLLVVVMDVTNESEVIAAQVISSTFHHCLGMEPFLAGHCMKHNKEILKNWHSWWCN